MRGTMHMLALCSVLLVLVSGKQSLLVSVELLLCGWRWSCRYLAYASARQEKMPLSQCRHPSMNAFVYAMQAADAQQLSTLQSLDIVPAGFPTTQKVAPLLHGSSLTPNLTPQAG